MSKIIYKKGNLFDTELEVIVHGVNCQGVMGSGVAKIIRDDFSEAYDVYVDEHINRGLILGNILPVLSNGKIIVNAMTQGAYGYDGKRYASYDGIAMCMSKINAWAYSRDVEKVAMPLIGSGLGGGDWDVIEKIIESEMTYVEPVVYKL